MDAPPQAKSLPSKNEPTSCAVCGSNESRTLFSEANFHIQECSHCHLAWTLPVAYVQQSSYEDHPEYAESYTAREKAFRGYAREFLRFIRLCRPDGRLLDVGCSVGLLVDEAKKLGYEAEGIDLDTAAVRIGCTAGRPLACQPLEDWPVRDYAVVCASHALEHFSTPLGFLREAAAHVRPGGYLALVVPCHRGLQPRVVGRRWYGWVAHQHYFHYSSDALTKLLVQAGLRVVLVRQNSMDYRPMLHRRGAPLRSRVKGLLDFAVATFGGFIGAGDQLVAIACKPPL